MQKILITGANGFIGSNFVKYFYQNGFNIYGVVRKQSNLKFLKDLKINLIFCDLKEIDESLFGDDYDFIIHTASYVCDYATESEAYLNIFMITKYLVEKVVLKQKNLSKFIFISSSLVLGYGKLNISESNPGISLLKNPYVKYKKLSEDYIKENLGRQNVKWTILRAADVYGPNDRTSCLHILNAISNNFPMIVGSGEYIFPFCSVDTLVTAVAKSLDNQRSDNQTFVVTNGIQITWKQFFLYFQQKMKKKQRIYIPIFVAKIAAFFLLILYRILPVFDPQITPYRIKRITTNTSYDISSLIESLGFTPETNYEKELDKILKWYLYEKNSGSLPFLKKNLRFTK